MRRSLQHRQSAVTVVTFALIAPVFLLIVFGTMEVGRVLNAWLIITNEAREAARYGAVTFDAAADPSAELAAERTAVRAYLAQRLQGVLDQRYLSPQPDVTLTTEARPRLQVTIYYRVPLVIPVVSNVLPNPFPVAARSAMRGE
jgi:Flp pilus assembly protein TadG